jgi:hypothetical protein
VRRIGAISIVFLCCVFGAATIVGLSRGHSAASAAQRSTAPRCPPAGLGQQSVVNEIEAVLGQRCLQDVYGGDEIQRDGRVHIYVANHGEGLITTALAPIATPGAYIFSPVPHTWASLRQDEQKVSMVALARRPHARWESTECYPDPARSSVIVEVKGDMSAARSQLHARLVYCLSFSWWLGDGFEGDASAADFLEDLLGAGGPDERGGVGVARREVGVDRGDQLGD